MSADLCDLRVLIIKYGCAITAGAEEGADKCFEKIESILVQREQTKADAERLDSIKLSQAVSTIRWMLNFSEDRPRMHAESLLDKTFSTDGSTNRQHLEWLCAALQSQQTEVKS